jgi:hypothetical protein
VEIDNLNFSTSPLKVSLDDRFLLQGASPFYEMRFTIPEEEAEARFLLETGWPVWWSKWRKRRVANNYVGQHASVKLEHRVGRTTQTLTGFGVMEHACGSALPFDFTRFLPVHFHWDVLAFHTPGAPFDSAVGLSLGRKGKTIFKVGAAGSMPDQSPETMNGLTVRYTDVLLENGQDGNEFIVPVHWEGILSSRTSRFRYQAHARTKVSRLVPGGGMIGFTFAGEWNVAGEKTRVLEGTGFCEYGDLSGKLVRMSGVSVRRLPESDRLPDSPGGISAMTGCNPRQRG